MNLKQKFGLRIKELRKALNMTQENISEVLNTEPPNISRLERGVNFPQIDKIEKLAELFDVPVYELFKFEHFSKREDLINKIIEVLNKSNQKDLELIYKIIMNLREYKNKI